MSEYVFKNAAAAEVVQRGIVTNVKGESALPFLHSCPVALSEAWNAFEDYASQCGRGAWYLHVHHTEADIEGLQKSVRWLPGIFDRLNNSRRMRRLGLTGARLSNVYRRGSSYLFVSDSVFTDWYAASVVAFQLVQLCMPSASTQRLIVRLRRGAYGRRAMHEAVGCFMRHFWDRSKYQRSHVTLDPIGNWEVQITTEGGLNMGLLALLMDLFGDQVEDIYIGHKVQLSREKTVFEDDYMETISKHYRPFRFKYLSTFGDFSSYHTAKIK